MTGELQPQCNVAVGKANMGMLQPKGTAHCLCQCPAGCTSPLHVTGAQEPTCLAVFPASCRNINVLEKSLLPLASSLWSHKGLHRGWTGCYIRREEFLLSIPLGWSSLVSHCFLKVLWHGYIRYRHLYAVGISSSKDSPCRILPLPSLSLIYPPE